MEYRKAFSSTKASNIIVKCVFSLSNVGYLDITNLWLQWLLKRLTLKVVHYNGGNRIFPLLIQNVDSYCIG